MVRRIEPAESQDSSPNATQPDEEGGISRREALNTLLAAMAGLLLPFRVGSAEVGQPALGAFASSTSVRALEAIKLYVLTTSALQSPVTITIREKGQGVALWSTVAAVLPFAASSDAYAAGYSPSPAAALVIPSTWGSGLYAAEVTDNQGAITNIPFVVKGPIVASFPILVVFPVTTAAAYNRWGGASLYQSEYPDGGYIHNWDGIRFSHQVSLDRPWIGWPNSFGWDFTDALGFIAFCESTVGKANLHYATSIDLHADASLLGRYNLMVSVGHDEYWSREMRNHVEAFVANGGNVCFLGGNTCWWQVRFERRDANGNLVLPADSHSMVCYKMEGSPVRPPEVPDTYPYDRDPMYNEDPTRTTTHWFVRAINRPENVMTGTSYRNGSYTGGWDAAQRSQLAYTVRQANHWIFKNASVASGSVFANGLIGPETDAAVMSWPSGAQGAPVVTGEDGSPLNFLVLATCQVPNGAVFPQTGDGWATMGLFRNNGVVFNTASLGWHYGLWGSGADPVMRQVTKNALLRLKQRGPWKFEEELHNAYFENWSTSLGPDHWIVEGPGRVYAGPPAEPTGNTALEVDARNGQMWITQDFYSLPPLWLEGRTRYRVGLWVKSTVANSVAVFLRGPSSPAHPYGNYFAVGRNTRANEWETVVGVAQNDTDGPIFPACVVMVVNQGAQASLSAVSVFEVATPATFRSGPITK